MIGYHIEGVISCCLIYEDYVSHDVLTFPSVDKNAGRHGQGKKKTSHSRRRHAGVSIMSIMNHFKLMMIPIIPIQYLMHIFIC